MRSLPLLVFLVMALCGEAQGGDDFFHYSFSEPIAARNAVRGRSMELTVSELESDGFEVAYEWREGAGETLTDVKALSFKRVRKLTPAEGAGFFSGLLKAGVFKLPKGDDYISARCTTQIDVGASGRTTHEIYNSPSSNRPRRAVHEFVVFFARKLGLDRPEDREKSTRVIEGDHTPARAIPFSALLTNPARYDDKRLAVTGYYHTEFEDSSFMRAAFKDHDRGYDRIFWLGGASKFAKAAAVQLKNDAWLRVEGIFDARRGGHMGLFAGAIRRITKSEVLPGPPDPATLPPVGEDDPHSLEKLTEEIVVAPFPMNGRPISEVVASLNERIATQLAARGLPPDWIRIELEPVSNPKARVETEFDRPRPLRALLGYRLISGEDPPWRPDDLWYRYVLPDVIRVRQKSSPYPDDVDPISWHEENFDGNPVRVQLIRYADAAGGPQYFRVKWQLASNPTEFTFASAMALARRILPEEPGAKSITNLEVSREEEQWIWSLETGAASEANPQSGGIMHLSDDSETTYGSPIAKYGGRLYIATLNAKIVGSSPPWNFDRDPPLEIGAAVEAARNILGKIPKATETLRLSRLYTDRQDKSHCFYWVVFCALDKDSRDEIAIPVLFSGEAIEPKRQGK